MGALFVLGFLTGQIAFLLVLIIFGTKAHKKKYRHVDTQQKFVKTRESANWINIFLARLNSSRIEAELIKRGCAILTKRILADPNRPAVLSKLNIAPLKNPDSTPYFSEFCISPGDNQSLSFFINYQGSPSVSISASASAGPADLPKLFTVNVNFEFLLKMLVAKISLIFTEEDEIILNIGNDLIAEFDVKPLFDDNRQQNIQSISAWLSNFIVKELRGKSFPMVL
ncbi:hypothetical protein GPJ56_004946 [Histomonas meleagridis]|uniref:uncharacterized protein n=1 Tax=Histomonas meleagridis TaxID=135588 RepID=UPI003559BE1C|nr:hypothetical protein GPJ56_004946 [Histomonas meleagridis]KAH0798528.1 hypothetical protein GO595_008393 [Histomonas meleagridis]